MSTVNDEYKKPSTNKHAVDQVTDEQLKALAVQQYEQNKGRKADTETEKEIQANLTRLTAGKTALIIAHRLSTIRNADRILVVEQGRVAEQGTHDELIRVPNGIYADLWATQVGGIG